MTFNIFTSNAKKLADFIHDTPELTARIYKETAEEQLILMYKIDKNKDNPISDDDINDFLHRHIELVRPEAEKKIENLCKHTMSYNWTAILGSLAVFIFCFLPSLHIFINLLTLKQIPSDFPSTTEVIFATLSITILFIASIVAIFILGRRKE